MAALAKDSGKVVLGGRAGAEDEDMEIAFGSGENARHMHARQLGRGDGGDGEIGELGVVDGGIGCDGFTQREGILTPFGDDEGGDAVERSYVYEVGAAPRIVAEVYSVGTAVAEFPVAVTVGDGDCDVAKHCACPTHIDWRGIAGGETIRGGGRLERGCGKVV